MLVVLGAMGLTDFIIPFVNDRMQVEGAMKRQDSPLYWLDSDYLQAVVAVISMLLFDLVERHFGRLGELGLLGIAGAAIGAGLQWLLASQVSTRRSGTCLCDRRVMWRSFPSKSLSRTGLTFCP